MAKKRPDDDLDTTTSFADMNVEGFRWYDPAAKKNKDMRKVKTRVTRKEYWAMVRGAFKSMLPFMLVILVVFGLMFLLTYLWLKR